MITRDFAAKLTSGCVIFLAATALLFSALNLYLKTDHAVFYRIYGAYPLSSFKEDKRLFRICTVDSHSQKDASYANILQFQMNGSDNLTVNAVLTDCETVSDKRNGFYSQKVWDVFSSSIDHDVSLSTQPLNLDRAIVTYSDGFRQQIKLGQVVLIPPLADSFAPAPLEQGYISHSKTISSHFYAEESLWVLSVDCIPKAPDWIDCTLKIRGIPADKAPGLKLAKGQWFEVEMNIENTKETLTIYEPIVNILLQDSNGKLYREQLWYPSADYLTEPSFFETWKVLKQRGEIG